VTPVAAAARVDAVRLTPVGVVWEAIETPAAGLAVEESDSVLTVKLVFV
jgi:hypothetical protein